MRSLPVIAALERHPRPHESEYCARFREGERTPSAPRGLVLNLAEEQPDAQTLALVVDLDSATCLAVGG